MTDVNPFAAEPHAAAVADVRVSLQALQAAQQRLVAAQTAEDPRGDIIAALALVTAVCMATERGLAALVGNGGAKPPEKWMN